MNIQDQFANLKNVGGFYIHPDWVIAKVSGGDRNTFLHNLVSQDILQQKPFERKWATLLTNKSKLIGFFQIWNLDHSTFLAIQKSELEAVKNALEQYWIAEDLSFEWDTPFSLGTLFFPHQHSQQWDQLQRDNQSASPDQIRPVGTSYRCLVNDFVIPSAQIIYAKDQMPVGITPPWVSDEIYEAIRIASAFPKAKSDYEDPIPMEIPFMVRAISFSKGCYIGQETIARLHSRGGNIARKLLPIKLTKNIDPSHRDVSFEGDSVGKITSISPWVEGDSYVGLAWIHRKAFGQTVRFGDEQFLIQEK